MAPHHRTAEPHLQLSPSARRNISVALNHSWARSTKSNYASAIKRFINFCHKERIPRTYIFPASEHVLSAFAASHVGLHAGTTARNNIAAVKAWHAYHNAPWAGGKRLRYILSGVANLAPISSRHPRRPPVTTSMLAALSLHLNRSSAFDMCVLAAALTAFWGQCRLGELLPRSTSSWACATPVVHASLG